MLPASPPVQLFRENETSVTLGGGSGDRLRNGQPRAQGPFPGSCCNELLQDVIVSSRSHRWPHPSRAHPLHKVQSGAELSPLQRAAWLLSPPPPLPALTAEQLQGYGDLELSPPRFGGCLLGMLLEPFSFPVCCPFRVMAQRMGAAWCAWAESFGFPLCWS